jgi:hypothetical protein
MKLTRCALFVALAVVVAGCGSEAYPTAPVSGRVTLDGQPLANAALTFQPIPTADSSIPGPGSGGVTDADGHYTLSVVGTSSRGAVVGKHKVRITMFQKDEADDDRPRKAVKSLVPLRYNSKDTPLAFDVPAGGSQAADFHLTSK